MSKPSLAFTVACTVAIAACQSSPTIPKLSAAPVDLVLRVSDSVFVLGGRADTISVIVRNNLAESVRLSFATLCQVQLFIRTQKGAVVLPATGKYSCSPVPSQISVAPSDSVVQQYIWTGGQSFVPPDPAQKLPPGVYFVTALMQATNYSTTAFPVRIRIAPAGS
jgi:hypothetical protein